MPADTQALSDKALSIFAFAAYHQLVSGERVSSVIRKDGHGHEADPEGVAELEQRGLATVSETQISLGEEAEVFVGSVISAIRAQAGR